jgi:phosphoesterase RecJ-like protein
MSNFFIFFIYCGKIIIKREDKMNELIIKEIKELIENSNNVALFTHTNCDCDGIGSMCALYEYIQEKNKNADMFCDSYIPEKYYFLKYCNRVNTIEFKNGKYDLLISLDTSTADKLGEYGADFTQFKNTINIDHHVSNSEYAKINYVIPNYSSCGEVMYDILKGFGEPITDSMATSVFAAISSDTNRFLYSNVNSRTHIYASELIQLGADINKVNVWLHRNKTLSQLKLIGYLTTNLKQSGGVAYIFMSIKTIKKLKVKSGEISDYMPFICDVEGNKITLVLKEKLDGSYHVNLRSVDGYDVGRIAAIFGGGGHKHAAGCTIYGSKRHVFSLLMKECFKEIAKNKKY